MRAIVGGFRQWLTAVVQGWNQFWFEPEQPHTLAAIRILAGAMLCYTHLVWSLDLMAFLGPDSWVPIELSQRIYADRDVHTAWSYLWYIESPSLLWILHLLALVVMALLTVGFFSRVVSILAWLITLSYCHRLNGSWFGLDQVNAMISMYLMLGPCGAVYSIDNWLKRRRGDARGTALEGSVGAKVAIRLIQLHLCVVYLFGGLSKMRGVMWWDGSATWFAVANLEYQSLDMTWLVHFPWLVAVLTHITVFWETFYCVLIWPRVTRPLMLALAVAVHGGIAAFLGMITFGLAMLIANLAFVSPHLVQAAVGCFGQRGRAGQGAAAGASGEVSQRA